MTGARSTHTLNFDAKPEPTAIEACAALVAHFDCMSDEELSHEGPFSIRTQKYRDQLAALMTALDAALACARQIDAAAALDAAREWPQHEDLYAQIGDLAGGLGYDPITGVDDTLATILPAHCERAAQKLIEQPGEYQSHISGAMEDAMDGAYADAATEWLTKAHKMAGPMLVTSKVLVMS